MKKTQFTDTGIIRAIQAHESDRKQKTFLES